MVLVSIVPILSYKIMYLECYSRQAERETGKVENALHRHTQFFHPGEVPEFQFEAVKFFSDVTTAQIYKGVCINHSPSEEGYLMNSKAEYQQC